MKAMWVVLGLMIAGTAAAELEKSPLDYYAMNDLITDTVLVTLVTTDDVNKACNAKNRQLGFALFTHRVQGCAFWRANDRGQMTCTIVVGHRTNNDILGHEIRHCFQGEFH